MRKWIGIDVGGTTIKGAAVLDDGTIVVGEERDTWKKHGTPFVLDTIATLVRQLAAKAGWEWKDINGVGVGIPGFINFETGVVETAVNLEWRNVPIIDELAGRLEGLMVKIENDANAAALGEVWFGGGRGFNDALCVTLGTGVGGGIIINKKIVHGSNGMAGEIGHLTIDPAGVLCNCGRNGCLETISSATGMVRMAKEKMDAGIPTSLADIQTLNTKDLFEWADKGDQVAKEVLFKAIDTLGFALSNICLTLNPQVVVIGGGVSKAGDALLLPLRQAFSRYSLPRILDGTTIRLAELGNDAGVIGASMLQRG